jgi:predicted RNA polymerase sigma factor
MPREAETHGLVALMELQASRMRARVDKLGNAIPLAAQNRAQWTVLDPFSNRWNIAQRMKNLSPQEMEEAQHAFVAQSR